MYFKRPFKQPKDRAVEELVADGRAFANSRSGKGMLVSSRFVSMLECEFANYIGTAKAGAFIQESRGIENALRAISNGDYENAKDCLVGLSEESLVNELRSRSLMPIGLEDHLIEALSKIPDGLKKWEHEFLD